MWPISDKKTVARYLLSSFLTLARFLQTFEMDVGYRRKYPAGQPIVPSDLFEKDTGIVVVQLTLFDKFGKQDVYPSFSPGSPAREAYNMKSRFDLNFFNKARDAKIAGELEPAFKYDRRQITAPPSPETDESEDMYLDDIEKYGAKEANKRRKKRDKKKKKKKERDMLMNSGGDTDRDAPKMLMFADEGVDEGS